MGEQKLQGKKVAIIAADMVEQVELVEPRKALEEAGAETDLVSMKPGEIQAFNHFDPADDVTRSTRPIEEVDAGDYDALMIPGGVGNPDQLRGDENIVAFVREFFDAGKPVAAICHGPWVLVEAGVVRGRKLTSWPTLQTDIRNAGGELGRRAGRRRPGPRHEPQARRHPGVQRQDDRGVLRGQARGPARDRRRDRDLSAARRRAARPRRHARRRELPARPRVVPRVPRARGSSCRCGGCTATSAWAATLSCRRSPATRSRSGSATSCGTATHRSSTRLRDECEPLEGARELVATLKDRGLVVVLASSAGEDDLEFFLDGSDARPRRRLDVEGRRRAVEAAARRDPGRAGEGGQSTRP